MIEAETPAAHQESVDLMRLGAAEVAANPDGISIHGPRVEPLVASGALARAAMLPGQPGYAMMVGQYRAMLAATQHPRGAAGSRPRVAPPQPRSDRRRARPPPGVAGAAGVEVAREIRTA